MSTVEERIAYTFNPLRYLTPKLHGDYTPFYVTITIFSVFALFLILLNCICFCCSKYQWYWKSKHTGNRWLFFGPVWTSTPHEQPPADISELKDKIIYDAYDDIERGQTAEYSIMAHEQPQRKQYQSPHHQQPRQMEYVEMQKRERESEI